HKRLARGFISLPIAHIRQGWDCDELALIEAGKRGVHHLLGGHHDLAWQVFDRRAGDAPKFGRCHTRHNDMNANVLLRQLLLERPAEGKYEGLGPTIDAVEYLRRYANDRRDI